MRPLALLGARGNMYASAMRSLLVAIGFLSSLLLAPADATSQTLPGPRVSVEAIGTRTDGGFGGAADFSVPALGPPGTYERSLSIASHGCVVGSAPYILNEAVGGWHVWVTPVATEGDAVTFRILWERSPNGNADAWNPGAEQTFTLKPGRVIPLDVISAPPRASAERLCSSSTLQVRVRRWPFPEEDRALVSTDVTLVQRLANGTERDHPLLIRSLYGEEMRFHFDSLEDGGVLLDFQGEFTAQPDTGRVVVEMTTRSRVVEDGVMSHIVRDGAMTIGREVESTLRLASDETATVDLPRLGENGSGAFANQTFFLRVRSRQVR